MTGFWRQVHTVIMRDLRRERRTAEVLGVTIPFGATAIILIGFVLSANTDTLRKAGPAILWGIVFLFGTLVAVRRTAAETPAQRDMLALTGADPAAMWVGQAAASALFMILFQVIVGIAGFLFLGFSVPMWWSIPVVIVLVGIGLAALGTLAGWIAHDLETGTALVPLIVAPLAIPLLLGASKTLDVLITNRGILRWIVLMLVVDLVVIIIGVLAARPLQENP